MVRPEVLSSHASNEKENDLEEKTRLVAKIERLLACQGFGGTLKTNGGQAALVERVSELLLRFAERGSRNQELVMRCNQLEKQLEACEERNLVKEDISSLEYYEGVKRENNALKASLRRKEQEVERERAVARKLRDQATIPKDNTMNDQALAASEARVIDLEARLHQKDQDLDKERALVRKLRQDTKSSPPESPKVIRVESPQLKTENSELKTLLKLREQELEATSRKLRDQFTAAKSIYSPHRKQQEDNQQFVASLRQENAELRATLRKKEHDLNLTKEKLVSSKISTPTKSNHDVTLSYKEDYDQVRQENTELNASLRKVEQEYEREKHISAKLRNELAGQMTTIRNLKEQNIQPEKLRLEVTELKASLRKKELDLEREKSTAWKLRDENANLRASNSSPQRIHDESLRRQLAEMGAALRKKDTELSREKSTARKLRDDLVLLKKEKHNTEDTPPKHDDVPLETAALRRKEQELEREKATARKLRDQLSAMKETRLSLSPAPVKHDEAEKYKQEVADANAALRRKDQELEKERTALKKVREQLRNTKNKEIPTTPQHDAVDGVQLRQQVADLGAALRRKEQELEREKQTSARKLKDQLATMKEAQPDASSSSLSSDLEIERARQKVIETSAALRKKEQELEREKATARKLRDEVSELKVGRSINTLPNESERLRLDFSDLRASLRKKEQDLEKERAVARKLRDENAELKASPLPQKTEDFQSHKDKLEIATLKASLRKREQELERERSTSRRLRDEKSPGKERSPHQKNDNEERLQSEVNELQLSLRKKDQELEKQRTTAQKLRDETTKTLRRSAQNSEAAIEQVRILRLEVNDLQSSLRKKEQEYEREQAIARKLRDENAELRTARRDQPGSNDEETAFLRLEVADLKATLRKKEQDLEREQATSRRLRDETAELRVTSADSTADREVSLLQQEVKELNASLQRRDQDLEREQTTARRLRDESALLRTQVQEATSSSVSTSESLRLECSELKASLRKREQELEREQTTARRLRDETALLRTQVQEATSSGVSTSESIRIENIELKASLRKREQELEREQTTARRLRDEVKEARDKMREAETNKEEATRQANDATKQIQRLEKTVQMNNDFDLEHTRDASAVFEAVHGRKPRPGSSADERALDMARIGVQARLQLEDAVATLKDEVLMARREAAKQRQKSAVLQSQVMSPAESTSANPAATSTEHEQVLRDKESELEVLRTRPSHREMREAQRRIEELEAELLEQRESERLYRKYAGTASLVARDKLDFSLKLRDIERLPRAFLADIVKQLCRRLKLADVARLEASIESLVKACSAIPTLNAFARDMISIFSAADILDDTTPKVTSPADCLALARKWQQQRTLFAELGAFRIAVSKKLIIAKRLAPAHQIQDVLFAVDNVLADLQAAAKRQNQFAKADALLATDDAHATIRHVFDHLSQLFDLKSLDGFIPRFTQLYSKQAELEHFKTAVHTALIEADSQHTSQSSPAALISALRHVLGLAPPALDFFDQHTPASDPSPDPVND